jgi:hypothetical protein
MFPRERGRGKYSGGGDYIFDLPGGSFLFPYTKYPENMVRISCGRFAAGYLLFLFAPNSVEGTT